MTGAGDGPALHVATNTVHMHRRINIRTGCRLCVFFRVRKQTGETGAVLARGDIRGRHCVEDRPPAASAPGAHMHARIWRRSCATARCNANRSSDEFPRQLLGHGELFANAGDGFTQLRVLLFQLARTARATYRSARSSAYALRTPTARPPPTRGSPPPHPCRPRPGC